MAKFQLGQIVMTAGVAAMIEDNPELSAFVLKCLSRYGMGDWGNTCEEDKQTNDAAVRDGNRILAAYTIDPSKGESKGFGDNTLWIITEWDRSVTTILFPDEY